MANYNVGDVVSVKTKKGPIDVVIKDVRSISKGRRAGMKEYQLAPVKDVKGVVGFRAVGSSMFGPPLGKYDEKTTAAATEKHSSAVATKQANIDARDQRRRATAEHMSAQPGDVITVRGRGPASIWKAVVADVNYRTGKIGVMRDESLIRRAEKERDRKEVLKHVYGLDVGSGRVQKMRWIPPEAIIRIKREGNVVWDRAKPPTAPPPAQEPADEPTKTAAPEGKPRKVYGKHGDANVHTRIKGRVYTPSNPPSKAKSGDKLNMNPRGDKLTVTHPDDGWSQEWVGEAADKASKARFREGQKVIHKASGTKGTVIHNSTSYGLDGSYWVHTVQFDKPLPNMPVDKKRWNMRPEKLVLAKSSRVGESAWKDADIERQNIERDEEEMALDHDPSGRWSSGGFSRADAEEYQNLENDPGRSSAAPYGYADRNAAKTDQRSRIERMNALIQKAGAKNLSDMGRIVRRALGESGAHLPDIARNVNPGVELSYYEKAQSLDDDALLNAIRMMDAEQSGAFGMSVDHDLQMDAYMSVAAERGLIDDVEELDPFMP